MRLTLSLLILLSFTVLSWGQQPNETEVQENFKTESVIKRVSKEKFKLALKDHPDSQVIDVRTPGEFQGGSINRALNIDFNAVDFKAQIKKLDKNKTTLIFCHGGGRSAKALDLMKELGFTHVLELKGGYSHW